MNPDNRLKLRSKLMAIGTERARENLLAGIYEPYAEVPIVDAWLKEQEFNVSRDSNRIARSAKNASWWAIVISAISLIISFIVLIKR